MKLSPLVTVSLVLSAASACGSTSPDYAGTIYDWRPPTSLFASPSRAIAAHLTEMLQLRIGTVGPGEFVSPPEITGTAVRFVGVSLPTGQVPAGVTQLFTVQAVAPGTSVIRFRNTTSPAVVEDTITVR